ncbi:DUF6233 domain-containing protein [Streptomyces sp. NPDC090231]|uniref:DUF6233 domain-containing protein n=1 Tax=unclassified Streptomyces TaxID=2593676 RepID=UPI002E148E1D|nr:DUF6233 domain-containing protein [Streptomyces sp. NBC_01324]
MLYLGEIQPGFHVEVGLHHFSISAYDGDFTIAVLWALRPRHGPQPDRKYRTPQTMPLHQVDGDVQAAEYRVWVRAPEHVRPVDGVSYDAVPTERLAPPSSACEALGPRRPSGWVLQKSGGRGPGRAVLHAVDCSEAPQDGPLLPLERALDVAEQPGTRLCSLCGAAQELDPVLRGFDHIGDD